MHRLESDRKATLEMNHRYSILVGNGVSLAYNPQLGVANLTAELQTEFENLGATAAEVALTKLATESRRDSSRLSTELVCQSFSERLLLSRLD
jgi:hypothetical protein